MSSNTFPSLDDGEPGCQHLCLLVVTVSPPSGSWGMGPGPREKKVRSEQSSREMKCWDDSSCLLLCLYTDTFGCN